MSRPDSSILYADGCRGIYIPQFFAQSVIRNCVAGVSPDDWAILEAGPEHDLYWDVWDDVLANAELTNPKTGETFTLWQDDDLWAVPKGAEWPDDSE